MTREEAKSCICTIKMLQKLAYNIHGVMDVIDADNCKKIIEALEQQPCEDKRLYIKVFADLEPDDIAEKIYQICDEDKFPKVVESLKEYFDFEPCEDCISRQAVLDVINFEDKWLFDAKSHNADTNIAFFTIKKKITEMPSVTPQKQKTGHWIKIKPYPLQMHEYECSECGHETDDTENYCSDCGARMVEPRESEG